MSQKTPSVGLRLGNGQGWGWSWAHYGEGGARGVYCGLMEASCAYLEGVFRSFKYPVVSLEGYETQHLSKKNLLTTYRQLQSSSGSSTLALAPYGVRKFTKDPLVRKDLLVRKFTKDSQGSSYSVRSFKPSLQEGDTSGLTYVFTVKVLANPLLSKGGFSTLDTQGRSKMSAQQTSGQRLRGSSKGSGKRGSQDDMPVPMPEHHLVDSASSQSFQAYPLLGTHVGGQCTSLQARVMPVLNLTPSSESKTSASKPTQQASGQKVEGKTHSAHSASFGAMGVWGELVQGWEHVGVSLDALAQGLYESEVGFVKGSRIVIRLEWVDMMSSAEALATALVYQMSTRRDRMPPSGMVKQWLKGRRASLPQGVRVWVSGRPNGVAMAQTEKMTWGRVPTSSWSHPISSSIRSHVTKFGLLTCRVWLHPQPLRPLQVLEGSFTS